jgi:hypothetical protein
MSFLRSALVVGVSTLTIGFIVMTSAQAQSPLEPTGMPGEGVASQIGIQAFDGQTLFNQTPETQALFTATWGARAAEVWAVEHNAQLVAAGFPIPTLPVAVAAPVDQSGAQVGGDDNDNESNDNDDRNDNDDDEEDSENDNGGGATVTSTTASQTTTSSTSPTTTSTSTTSSSTTSTTTSSNTTSTSTTQP